MIVEIVILAMIAAFLGLRLYSVLGRRAEHNEEPIQGPQAPGLRRPDPLQPGRTTPARPEERSALPPRLAPNARAANAGFDSAAEPGIRAIVAADRRFDVAAFLEGARGAYAMVLEAFWRGDKAELAQLCDPEIYQSFADAIDARQAAGETIDNRLIRIEEAVIDAAELVGTTAQVRVRFVADVASVTRNAAGEVIAGSLDDAIESRDLWTFSRDVTSREPDWLLTETDEG